MSDSVVTRIVRRSALILLVAGVCGLALYALAQTPLAAQLALAMNVSEPLVALDHLVQGEPGGGVRGRGGLPAGVNQVIRDTVVLAVVVAGVVVIDRITRRRRRKARR